MSKEKTEEDEDIDDIDNFEYIDSELDVYGGVDARRRLEKIMEDKELNRLINGIFYD